ncbi:MAG: Gfo/Idh/MocA family oxidoreductase [Clostridia bacterium]|nr:Gfo/Idh/MocA family oxidoreductase [Clostridia bacterium]MBQ5820032.1 Gfo/Idh/MocA family oxidoreductase [Clostridia bacterium]
MIKNKLNIAVIGCSTMAQFHMDGILKQEEARLYAVCDTAPERLEECSAKYKPERAVADYRELVADPKVDAVILVTPDQVHLEMAEAFLRAGKDVLCEKPMALTVEECEKMMQAERESGKRLMIGQVCRCTPAFLLAKSIIDAGRIGELFFVESEYAHNYDNARGYADWRVTPERHAVIGGGCHAIDLLRWIAGDPTEVYALANHKCLPDWPVDDCTVALFQFPNHVAGKVFTSIGCRRNYTMRSVFYGTKGTIICDNTSPTITLFESGEPINGKRAYTVPQEIPVEINNHNVTEEISVFLNALINDLPMPVTSREGANTVAVCCATVKSAKEGRPVTIEYPKA